MTRLNDTEHHMMELANKLDAIEPAARAMLAALRAAQEHVGIVRLQTGFDVQPIRDAVTAAIAQAEAAGIKVSP